MRTIARVAFVCSLAAEAACGLVGPSCVDRQRRGTVGVVTGRIEAAQMVAHLLPYGTEGSQNDIELRWTATSAAAPVRLEAYATRAGCSAFELPVSNNTGECRVLAAAAAQPDGGRASLIVTHGRGNPEILGSPAEFTLWVVGDATQPATYTVTTTWFRGPDC